MPGNRHSPFISRLRRGATCAPRCRPFAAGLGIEPASLSPEAQAMLPLIAGQLLREAVVGLQDLAQSRAKAFARCGRGTVDRQ